MIESIKDFLSNNKKLVILVGIIAFVFLGLTLVGKGLKPNNNKSEFPVKSILSQENSKIYINTDSETIDIKKHGNILACDRTQGSETINNLAFWYNDKIYIKIPEGEVLNGYDYMTIPLKSITPDIIDSLSGYAETLINSFEWETSETDNTLAGEIKLTDGEQVGNFLKSVATEIRNNKEEISQTIANAVFNNSFAYFTGAFSSYIKINPASAEELSVEILDSINSYMEKLEALADEIINDGYANSLYIKIDIDESNMNFAINFIYDIQTSSDYYNNNIIISVQPDTTAISVPDNKIYSIGPNNPNWNIAKILLETYESKSESEGDTETKDNIISISYNEVKSEIITDGYTETTQYIFNDTGLTEIIMTVTTSNPIIYETYKTEYSNYSVITDNHGKDENGDPIDYYLNMTADENTVIKWSAVGSTPEQFSKYMSEG